MSLHPSFNAILREFHNGPDFYELVPDQNRKLMKEFFKKPAYTDELANVKIEDRSIQIIDARLPMRIYRSKNPTLSSLIWFHGGGFVAGDLDSSDLHCRLITSRTNRTVISVHYRLAPEFPFPTPPEDCFSACQWIVAHAKELEIQPEKIAIGGVSAGATLATVVCLMTRDRDLEQRFEHQLLIMPVIDKTMKYSSYTKFGSNHMLTTNAMKYVFKHYAKSPIDLEHPYCLPINAKDLSNLPPATIAVAECDPLHDEGVHYADLLKKSDIEVNLIDLQGVFHGFIGQAQNNEFARTTMNYLIDQFEKIEV